MPDKLIYGGIVAFFTAVLTFIGRATFVRKSEIYRKDGKPLYQRSDDCIMYQRECSERTCKKIDELKGGQRKVFDSLVSIKETLARIDQKVIDHDKTHNR